MSLTSAERETVVQMDDATQLAHVYTAQRPVLTRLRRNPAATEVESGNFEGTEWARFTLPRRLVTFRTPRRLTEEAKAQSRASLEVTRAALKRSLEAEDSDVTPLPGGNGRVQDQQSETL